MKSPAVKFAFYALIITVIWTLIEHFLGYNTTNHETGQYTRMVGSLVFYLMIVFSLVSLRKQQGGMMTFGQGFKSATVMSLVYSLGLTIWYAIYGELINTQYKPTLMAFERAKQEAQHATPEMIDAHMKQIDMSTGGSVMSYVFLFVIMSVTGIVLGAIVSLILKRERR